MSTDTENKVPERIRLLIRGGEVSGWWWPYPETLAADESEAVYVRADLVSSAAAPPSDAAVNEAAREIAEVYGLSHQVDSLVVIITKHLHTTPSTEAQKCVECGHDRNDPGRRGSDEFSTFCVPGCGCKCAFSAGALRTRPVEQECTWTYDPDGYWQTSCDDQFMISNEQWPKANGMKFCHQCCLLIVVPTVHTEGIKA
jgi:hypothetical protein